MSRVKPSAVAEVDWGLPPIEPAQVGVGLPVLLGAYVVGRLLEVALRPYWRWRGRSPSFATVFAMLTKWLIILLGFGAGLTIAFPSVRPVDVLGGVGVISDRKSTRLNSSHVRISYAVFCLKKKKIIRPIY